MSLGKKSSRIHNDSNFSAVHIYQLPLFLCNHGKMWSRRHLLLILWTDFVRVAERKIHRCVVDIKTSSSLKISGSECQHVAGRCGLYDLTEIVPRLFYKICGSSVFFVHSGTIVYINSPLSKMELRHNYSLITKRTTAPFVSFSIVLQHIYIFHIYRNPFRHSIIVLHECKRRGQPFQR